MAILRFIIIPTKHWLRLLAKTNPEIIKEIRLLWQEAQELVLIFSKSISTSKKKSNEY